MLKGKNIVLGVTGGIAVYKAVDIVSRFKKLGANIDIIMTKSATEFVNPLTFQSLALNKVVVDMFEKIDKFDIEHISLAKKADIFLVAPATANIIGKVANGIADDMLSTTIMATKAENIIFSPAMNTNMYQNPIFQGNVEKLKSLGYDFIPAISGRLSCGDIGAGKFPNPEDIVNYVLETFESKSKRDLEGKKIMVTAGATQEPLDPVRYMTNHSSGKMGFEIAKAAYKRGADVTLVSREKPQEMPESVTHLRIQTTEDLLEACKSKFDTVDAFIGAAAPVDYRPKVVSDKKIKKVGDTLTIEYVKTPDVIAHMGKLKNKQVLVGFAAETNDVIENAKKKVEKKNLDFIVANDVSNSEIGFKSDNNKASLIFKNGNIVETELIKKSELADIILDHIIENM